MENEYHDEEEYMESDYHDEEEYLESEYQMKIIWRMNN